MKTTTTTKVTDHPLESVFDIVPCSTVVESKEVIPADVVDMPNYDAKDNEIEDKYEEIYAAAMTNVITITDEIDRVEGKYKARMGEVSATMLTVALNAAQAKSQLKMHKDKLTQDARTGGTPHTLNQNLIVTDRNEILQMLRNKNQ